jgi:hypothetical protein
MERCSEKVLNFLNKIFLTKEDGFQKFFQSVNEYIASEQTVCLGQHNCHFCEMILTLPDDDQLMTEKMICVNLLTERLPLSTLSCVIIWYYIKDTFKITDEEKLFQIDIWSIFKHFMVGDCKTIKQYNGYSANLVYKYLEVKNEIKTKEECRNKTLNLLFSTVKHLHTYGPCYGYNIHDKTRCIYSNCGSYDNNVIHLPSLKPFISRDYNNLVRENILLTKLTTGNVDDHCEVNLADSFQFQVKQDFYSPISTNNNEQDVLIDKWNNIKRIHNIITSISGDDTYISFLNNTLGVCLMCSLSMCDVFRICLEDFNCMCHDFLIQKKLLTNNLPVTAGLIKTENLGSKSYSRLSAFEAECKYSQTSSPDKKCTYKKHKTNSGGILSFQLDRHTNISHFTCTKVFAKWVVKYSTLHLDYLITDSNIIYAHFVGGENFFCVSNRRRVFYNSDDIFTKSHSCLLPFFLDLGCLLYKERSSDTRIDKILTSNIFGLAKQHHIPEDYITHMIT